MIGPRIARVFGVAVLSLISITCSSVHGYRPHCSALDSSRVYGCGDVERSERLTCDPAARVTAALSNLHGFEHQDGGEGVHHLFGPGTEQPTAQELLTFVTESERYPRALVGVRSSYAPADCRDATQPCALLVVVDHCTGPTLDVLTQHAQRWARGLGLENKRLAITLQVNGTGPRCAASDPQCGPDTYHPDASAEYIPGRGRYPYPSDPNFEFFDRDEHPCTNDGDCAGYGAECLSWVEINPQGMSIPAVWHTYLEDKLCGCVAARCTWFTQD